MTKLEFSGSVATATKSAETIVYVAAEKHCKAGWLANVADSTCLSLLERAARETGAGMAGKAIDAQVPGDEGPKRVVLIVLPDERSRHNCPARSEEAAQLLGAAGLLQDARVAVVACLDDASHALAIARAVGRACPLYSRTTGESKKTRVRFAATDPDGVRIGVTKMDRKIVESARWAAWLVDTPPAELTTTDFVKRVRQAARGIESLSVSVIKGDELLRRGMGGLHAVGRTAIEPPHLLVMKHKARGKRHFAVVGKGVIYDTGGLSLKVGGHMAGMKCDMGGAAAAAGATLALAAGGFRHKVTCVLGLVENAIGPDSYRPDDILEMHSGKTVEINNTDAEGRLVLADAASYIARKHKLTALVDLATLTGAQLIATGKRHAAVVSNRDGLEAAAIAAGKRSGDLVAPLPFAPEFFQSNLRSPVADMRNSVKDRMDAQSSCAGQFIYSHIDDLDLPWLHVDLAGPAFRAERGTGFGVALVAQMLRDVEPSTLTS